MTLACAGGFLDVVKVLLHHGAQINLGQSSALMEASQEGHLELVQYLLAVKADVQQRTSTGDSALAFACEGGHVDIVETLVNAGAPIDQADKEGRTPLMKAARAGHIDTVRYLLSKGLFHSIDDARRSPFFQERMSIDPVTTTMPLFSRWFVPTVTWNWRPSCSNTERIRTIC